MKTHHNPSFFSKKAHLFLKFKTYITSDHVEPWQRTTWTVKVKKRSAFAWLFLYFSSSVPVLIFILHIQFRLSLRQHSFNFLRFSLWSFLFSMPQTQKNTLISVFSFSGDKVLNYISVSWCIYILILGIKKKKIQGHKLDPLIHLSQHFFLLIFN